MSEAQKPQEPTVLLNPDGFDLTKPCWAVSAGNEIIAIFYDEDQAIQFIEMLKT